MTQSRYGRRSLLFAGATLAIARGVQAQQMPPLVSRKLLFSAPERTKATISPNGKVIAYLGRLNSVLNVFVAPIDSPEAGKPLTKITDRDVKWDLVWPYDNRHVVFFREQ